MPDPYENTTITWEEDDPDFRELFRDYAETSGDTDFDYMSLTGSKL